MASTIIDFHLSVWSPVLNSRDVTGKDVIEFSKKFEKLREALSCSVCNQLLTNREVLSPTKCREHFICKACKGKKRNDSKKCNLCDDWDTFTVDEDLNDIIKSYQGFCFYFLTNPHIRRVLEVKQEVDPNFNPDRLIDLIAEGFKGLPLGEKRKLRSSLNENRGVVPLDVPIKRKKTASKATTVDRDALEKELTTSATDNHKETKVKADTKKPPPESITPTQDKTSRIQVKTLSEAKAANKVPVSSSPSVKHSSPAVNTPPTTPKPECLPKPVPSTPEPTISRVRTPPSVQIKVEVSTPMTTPEKQHPSRNDGNASPLSCTPNVSKPEKILPDPLESPLRSQSFLTAPRPMVSTSYISSLSGTNTSPTVSYRFATPSIVSSQPSGGPQIIQIAHPTGIKTISIRPHQFRLAGVAGVPGGRLPYQILSTAATTTTTTTTSLPNPPPTTNNNIREAIITTSTAVGSSPVATKGKTRYVFAAANPHDLQRWPDTNKILQLTAGEIGRFSTYGNIRPGLFSVAPSAFHQLQGLRISSSSGAVRPAAVTSTTVSLVRPSNSVTAAVTRCASPIGPTQSEMPSSSTHGTPKYSPSTQVQFIRTMAPTSAPSVGSVVQPQGFTTASATITRQVPSSSSPSPSTANPIIQLKRKSEGCRCGNATPTPGKLTCIGQRCACYADRNACSDCKCKGCKNPYVPGSGGKKVLHGVRALIDPHTNQAIPIIATPVGPPGSCSAASAILTSQQNVTSTSVPAALMSTIGHSGGFGPMHTGTTAPSSVGQPMPPFQLIPVRFGPSGVPQYIQISNPHALQQMPIILSSSGQMQTNSPSGITIQGIPVSGLNNPGIHHMAHFQQQQQQQQQPRIPQVNVKNERTPQHKD